MRYTVLTCILLAASTAGALEAYVPFCWFHNPQGLWLSNTETGVVKKICDARVDAVSFSLDGTRIYYADESDDCLYEINNDGTGLHKLADGVQFDRKANFFEVNEAGIFWCQSRSIKRYNPATGQITSTNIYSGDYKGYWASRDGRKAVAWLKNSESLHPLIEWDASFANPTVRWVDIWGHGWNITQDGSQVIINPWSGSVGLTTGQHREFVFFDFETALPVDNIHTNRCGETSTSSNLPESINSPDYLAFRENVDTVQCGMPPRRYWIINWKTEEFFEVASPDKGEGNRRWGHFWVGPLPPPHTDGPAFVLSHSSARFFGVQDTHTVAVTNGGTGTLGTPAVSVDPPGASWVHVSTTPDGNGFSLELTVDTAGLADSTYSATLTLSGGGSVTTPSMTVSLSLGALPPPTDLVGSLAPSGDEARLYWRDNSADETGFIVERRYEQYSWMTVATPGANATSFVDTGLTVGTTYEYRVKAVRDTVGSLYSNTASVLVSGAQLITIISPAVDEQVPGGFPYTIEWNSEEITSVKILYTLDEGETWVPITTGGSIDKGTELWGNYPWQVPDTTGSAQVRIEQYTESSNFVVSAPFTIVSDGQNALDGMTSRAASGNRLTVSTAGGGSIRLVYRGGGSGCVLEVLTVQGRRLHRRVDTDGSGVLTLDRNRSASSGVLIATMTDQVTGEKVTRRFLGGR